MHYHIVLTEKCNLNCRYCYEKSMNEFDNSLEKKFKFDFSDPCVSQVKIEDLKKFISKDSEAVIIFYGGEPLLQIPKIKEIMDNINVPFRIQTNGQLLHLLEPEYLNRIGKILISIDGDRERTDKNRGEGTYDKIISNIDLMRRNGYSGEIIARMTIAQDCPDLYEQIMNLINTGFTSIHYQLDVGFYAEDFEKEKISNFFEEYNKSVLRLINWWIGELEKGRFHLIYPLVGIVKPLLTGEKMQLRCGAGHSGYAISTSGKVVACPIMNNIESFKAGTLSDDPSQLKKFDCSAECGNCEIKDLCGGRCMYWRKAGLWPEEGDKMICDSIKFYINYLKEKLPEILELVEKGVLKKEYFEYEEYFGPEIIP